MYLGGIGYLSFYDELIPPALDTSIVIVLWGHFNIFFAMPERKPYDYKSVLLFAVLTSLWCH